MGGKKNDVRIDVPEQPEETSSEIENMDDVHTPLLDPQVHPSTKGTSSSSSSSSFTSDKLIPADRTLLERIQKAGDAEKKEAENVEGSQTKIQKAPDSVLKKEILEGYKIEPTVIAIGDFYSRHDTLKNENLKLKLAARFIQNSGKKGETILTEFKEKFTVDELKMVYRGNVHTKNQEKLTRTYFLDGCTVLQFIDSYVNNGIEESDKISNGDADKICHDLFLLENQIPFKALVILMRLSDRGVELAKSIYCFCSLYIMAPVLYSKPRFEQNISRLPVAKEQLFQGNNVPIHLLDLLRSELLFDDYSETSSAELNTQSGDLSSPKKEVEESGDRTKLNTQSGGLSSPKKEVEEGGDRTELNPLSTPAKKDEGVNGNNLFSSYYKRSFRNVQDLKEVGITLKADYSSGLRSVSFSSRLFIFGQLKLPPLIVDGSTKQKLLNLAAYEMCPGYNSKKDYTVISYLRLLDSLIDSEQDVKDLRSAHILRNNLSSDAEVAQLFNTMNRGLVSQDTYSNVKKDIQKYYERKIASWKAQFCTQYCRNPWTVVALLGAMAALILTGIQTYYSVNPKK